MKVFYAQRICVYTRALTAKKKKKNNEANGALQHLEICYIFLYLLNDLGMFL